MSRTCLSIVLAAGEGTRMKSGRAKVLHEVAGLPIVLHAAKAAVDAGSQKLALVVGRDAEAVVACVGAQFPSSRAFPQAERLGTAHAVLAARAAIAQGFDDVLVLFGDTPLVKPETLVRARAEVAAGAAVCVVGFRTQRPTGYGRLLMQGADLAAIREEKDASNEERRVDLCNGGVMALAGSEALALLDEIGNANAKGEFYLTDIVEIARARGLAVRVVEADETEVLGVNTRVELAAAEAIWQGRRRRQTMLAGVTLVAPDTVFFAHDTRIEADVIVEPNVVFGSGVRIATGAVIHAFSHLEGADVGACASVGPFARLRPGTRLGEGAKVGNFVETKNAAVGAGAKVSHLTYLGDAVIGAESNIGAGTITCNYDGYNKYRTEIGASVFIGSNSSLVAPIHIGDGAYVGSGSVVTEDVPPDALALGRARQVVKAGRGREINERNAARKRSKPA
ncbi:bifunctional UDP-N-acetylglucosamine diphosphorylase/glucosamine-1-phosphate N-acetyltransferase GlmU [Aureimonas pseudogalii]|uniref:Bifunctional protein GlmU n=1 Tax=Aureimonas pseudogalii TaxID=1744844 RepID=A0A7W6H8H1_9HYPH|nr:bifunctional UDP-N-acetylglucosamine diphosphorylase/glucosamine-1-phosphate N-acetyltransferase GlmU [Aureimonas pseudogalii]MBB4000565.1 bifunctional UDP-N-acetylglucosamine pyrophosphorylase/glucosamine-1-phosphate N-acetyltransferase [Aureimonas pseudogalii]